MVAISTRKSYIDPHDLPEVERVTIRRILGCLRPYRRHVAAVVALMLVCALLNLVPPVLIKRTVDQAIPNGNLRELWVLCILMVLGPLVASLIQVGQKYLTAYTGERVMFDLRTQLYEHLQRQPVSFFTKAKPGEALSRVLNDVQGTGSLVSSTLVDLVNSTIVFVTTAIVMFMLDWRLALFGIVFVPSFAIPTRRVGRKRKVLRRQVQLGMQEMTGILAETLTVSGALLTRVFGTERLESARLRKKADEVMQLSLKQTLVGRWFSVVLGLFETAGPALIYAIGGWLVFKGHAQLGTLIAFVQLLKRLYSPASNLATVHVDLVTSYAYFDRIFAVLDLEPACGDLPDARTLDRVRGDIELRHVSFSYGEDDVTLKDIDLHVPAGTFVAIVGPSGAGKTTLVGLLPRLYDATAGSVLVDGVDVKSVTLASLRAQIGVVTQETYLFHDTIRANLRYARADATDEEIEAAARAAQIHHVIAAMPEGYDTVVGDRGFRLSGGERQRVALARVLIKDPRILILDEATSALDPQSERLVQGALDQALHGRTSFVIAHRLGTVRRADIIVVLDKGVVVEKGSHDELVASGGLYARLHRQLFAPEEAEEGQEAAGDGERA
ncbi:MAG TPA: ABC transporter ATP-binding protein, partial [Kofleriaceae bacterium]|nr:ABC transporter ATP-binding protein [Kofleriaceae bacterium]